MIGIATNIPVPIWKDKILGGIFSVLPNVIGTFNPADGDLVVQKDSQRNGQASVGTEFPNIAHSDFGTPTEMLGLVGEPSSPAIANRAKELLSTYNPQDWQGVLKP